ncbi:hypothetical protein CHS0354_011443 [Potamilus streckersoni]|uniref:VWFA domain-containing protein n=1 Tax=Potamilus streckersoni TaxID=2493646 RepID=A0AAE0SKU2_9BIVA|nr:hypothetical protein CHS0354_011443 [Potamilus streckersoni]
MEFGSDFVYVYEEPEFEYISEDEYDVGMNLSDSDEDDVPAVSNPAFSSSSSSSAPPPSPYLTFLPPSPRLEERRVDYDSFETVPQAPMGRPPPPLLKVSKPAKTKKHHWRHLSDSGDQQQKHHRSEELQQKLKKFRKADTNIVSLKLNQLVAPGNMHAGDPTYCTSCGAIMSSISKLKKDIEEKVWTCEFCNAKNVVDVEDEEVPTSEDLTYMLEPALSTTVSGPSGTDQSLVLFCVDISGSMCVTTEVPGNLKLRGAESLHRAQLLNRERGDQYLPKQRRNVTYISRLQSVQAAVDHQLEQMCKDHPHRRVALVTFNNEVEIIGDGKTPLVSIVGDKLKDSEQLKSSCADITLTGAIKNNRKSLGEKLFDLEEGGGTALGPALLVSVTIASKHPGSKVILCTDGLANVGLGKLEDYNRNDEEAEQAARFYEDIGKMAVEKGVSVSVITIKGTDCKLVELGKLADTTGGQVNIVDPMKLTQEFSTILANQVIATNVVATFILHKQLFFHNEETVESKIIKNIGNVTQDTEITFEYGMKIGAEKKEDTSTSDGTAKSEDTGEKAASSSAGEGSKITVGEKPEVKSEEGQSKDQTKEGGQPEEFPFQIQIAYTDTEGAKALRVLTKTKPTTRDRKIAERNMNLDVLGAHTAQLTSNLAIEGRYTLARSKALINQRAAWRNVHDAESKEAERTSNRVKYKKFFGRIRTVDEHLKTAQNEERKTHGSTHSDEEDDMYDMAVQDMYEVLPTTARGSKSSTLSSEKRAVKKKMRSRETEDKTAALVYKAKKSSRYLNESDSD